MKKILLIISFLLLAILPVCIYGQQPNFDKLGLGDRKSMVLSSQMPYINLKLGNAEGFFQLDFGTNISSIDHQRDTAKAHVQ
jgi:hypothetical protein